MKGGSLMPTIKSKPYIPKGAPLWCRLFHRRFVAVLVEGEDITELEICPKIAYWVCKKCDRMVMPA
jgi:hypothetical protein